MRQRQCRSKRRLTDSGGFTLSELMVCCVIMLIVGGLVTQTLVFGFRQSGDRSRDSVAVVLCGALETKTRTILEMATNYTADTDSKVKDFWTDAYGLTGYICKFSDNDGQVTLDYNKSDDETATKYPLVSEGSYGNGELKAGITVKADDATNGVPFRFEVTITVTDTANKTLVEKVFHVLPVMEPTPIPTT